MSNGSSAEVRAGLDHPIVDADGHFVELAPLMHDEIVSHLEEAGGAALRDRYLAGAAAPTDTSSILAGRSLSGAADSWSAMPSWWGWPAERWRDRATAHIPALLYERLDEMGIDFTVLYPSMSLAFLELADEELAPALCRAVNRMNARAFAKYSDRTTVGALIPMLTPEIAVTELRYAVEVLGAKAAVMAGYAKRPIAKLAREHGPLSPSVYRLDHFGLDSTHDYDPFWQACCDLQIAPVSHSSVQYHDLSRSVSNYVYNHVDGLAKCHEALAKSLFLGGVTARFPKLRLGFLEGGVAWACSLYAGLQGHWDKRNAAAIGELDPARLDVEQVMHAVVTYGDPATVAAADRIRAWLSAPAAHPAELDEFAAVGAGSASELRDRFVPSFYFGCEADDPLVPWAFDTNTNPGGAQLRAMIGSDIAHWDVRDMNEPIAEAHEAVEQGRMSPESFRDFAFVNPLRLHMGMNPGFFDGTVVEAAARAALAAGEVTT